MALGIFLHDDFSHIYEQYGRIGDKLRCDIAPHVGLANKDGDSAKMALRKKICHWERDLGWRNQGGGVRIYYDNKCNFNILYYFLMDAV